MRDRPLDGEDPLEEGMATQCSILAWRIPWTEEPEGLQSMGSQRAVRTLSLLRFVVENNCGMQILVSKIKS